MKTYMTCYRFNKDTAKIENYSKIVDVKMGFNTHKVKVALAIICAVMLFASLACFALGYDSLNENLAFLKTYGYIGIGVEFITLLVFGCVDEYENKQIEKVVKKYENAEINGIKKAKKDFAQWKEKNIAIYVAMCKYPNITLEDAKLCVNYEKGEKNVR